MNTAFAPYKFKKLRPLGDTVLVSDMVFDQRLTTGGILLLNDNGKTTGIRPRWGRVYEVGPAQDSVTPGQWVLVAHGRWTRGLEIEDDDGVKTIRKIDPADILMVSDEYPDYSETFGIPN
jgi:co-chaperonin GroES (HSP10)